jgi:hypothetical protein
MPFYCGKHLQASGSFSARKNPQRIPANTLPVFSSLRPRICQHLVSLATKDYSDRLLGPFGTKAVARSVIHLAHFARKLVGSLPRHPETHRATLTRNRLLLDFLHL